MLALCDVDIDCAEKQTFAGVPNLFSPKILLEPSFAISMDEIR
jgi:hypothetical protein